MAWAQLDDGPASPDAPSLVPGARVVQPEVVHVYPRDTWIRELHLSPDREHLYGNFAIGSVNLWAVLVFWWPEIASAAIALVLLGLLWRVVRRRRVIGRPHCRRCNYELRNHHGERCPECGVDLSRRRPVIGRSRWPRLVLLSSLLVIVVASYVAGHEGAPRRGRVSRAVTWLSPQLYDWAWRNGHEWLYRHKTWIARFVEIDPISGRIVRTVYERPKTGPLYAVVSSDGQSVALWDHRRIARHDIETGARLSEHSIEGNAWADPEHPFIQFVAPSRDDGALFIATANGSVQSWDVGSGEAREMMRVDHGYVSILTLDDDRHVAVCDRMNRVWWRHRTWDASTGQLVHEHEDRALPAAAASPSADRRSIFVTCPRRRLIQEHDARTGDVLRQISTPPVVLSAATQSPSGRWLLAHSSTAPPSVWVHDLVRDEWVAELRGPVTQMLEVHVLAGERTVVALGTNTAQGGIEKIMVYDLSVLMGEQE